MNIINDIVKDFQSKGILVNQNRKIDGLAKKRESSIKNIEIGRNKRCKNGK